MIRNARDAVLVFLGAAFIITATTYWYFGALVCFLLIMPWSIMVRTCESLLDDIVDVRVAYREKRKELENYHGPKLVEFEELGEEKHA